MSLPRIDSIAGPGAGRSEEVPWEVVEPVAGPGCLGRRREGQR